MLNSANIIIALVTVFRRSNIQRYSLTCSMRNCPPLTAAWYRESCLHLATVWCRVAYIHTCLQ